MPPVGLYRRAVGKVMLGAKVAMATVTLASVHMRTVHGGHDTNPVECREVDLMLLAITPRMAICLSQDDVETALGG